MSLPGFEVLRHDHRDKAEVIDRLENLLERTLSKDRSAIIDERIVGQELGLTSEATNRLMVELVSANTLEPVFFWMCPTNDGSIREERSLAGFPDRIDCERCGRQHYFSTPDVEVHFLPSDRLRESLT